MSSIMPPAYVLIATSIGLCLSTSFSIGSLALSYFAIPAILLPSDAPLMPPLELVTEVKKRHFRTEKAPKQPLDTGVGDESETLLDSGATENVLRTKKAGTGSPSTTSYLLRQWFHLFSKGMHTFPPFALSSAACYAFSGAMVPGPINARGPIGVKRGLFALATVLSAGIMVFTLTLLKPVNTALHERVKEVVEQEAKDGAKADIDDKRGETESLIRQWGKMNAWRAVLPVLAAISAVAGLAL